MPSLRKLYTKVRSTVVLSSLPVVVIYARVRDPGSIGEQCSERSFDFFQNLFQSLAAYFSHSSSDNCNRPM